jgi:outer membrane protein assembly factor BamD
MKKMRYNGLVLFMLATLMFSCQSEFEKIRTSGDPELLYKSALTYYEEESYQKAQSLLELVISSYRGQKEAEDIYFKYAYTYYNLENYILATYYFKNFSQTYPTSDLREEADFMSAYSNYQLSPTFRLDQSYTNQAIEEFQLFVNTHPNSERVDECNRLIDEMRDKLEVKALEEGKLYFNVRQYQAAIQVFENLLKDFPDTDRAAEIRFRIVNSAYLLAENSVVTRQEERYEEVLTLANEYLRRYKTSDFRSDVERFKENSEQQIKGLENVGYQN